VSSQIVPAGVSATMLPKWIAHDDNGRIFTVTGPAKAITVLAEMYHP
jgi:hypothetical protein